MCTSFIYNGNRTLAGWNLDILDMEHRVRTAAEGVFIEINDAKEGWMPLFGVNSRGDFVGMPTCWPFDARSNPTAMDAGLNVINLDIDLLLMKRTFEETRQLAETSTMVSVPGVTFMSAISDKNGNYLQVIPGQGIKYYEKPHHQVTTNFSPFKADKEQHPWMGWDRYQLADKMLEEAGADLNAEGALEILKAVSQEVCPTVVSMVLDVSDMRVYLCENRDWSEVKVWNL